VADPIQTDIDRNPAWWTAWFKADYSWDGLARLYPDDEPVHPWDMYEYLPQRRRGQPVHPWQGWVVVGDAQCVPEKDAPEDAKTRPATLQDYWRADPDNAWRLRSKQALEQDGLLLTVADTPDGRTWHIVHVPPGPPPGELMDAKARTRWFKASLKPKPGGPGAEAWARLNVCLAQRLCAAEETKVRPSGQAQGADRRAQLDGAVLKAFPTLDEEAASPLHLSLRGSAHLGDARYANAHFGPGARFHSASFAGYAGFNSARFSGHAGFDSARFAGNARFKKTSFAGDAGFNSASFAGNAEFESGIFASYADFRSTSFAGYADFESTSFASYAEFTSASFARFADFSSASFAGYAWFTYASFAGAAQFNSASFARETFFISASFAGGAGFNSANFASVALFQSASFARVARFTSASFLRRANFRRGDPPDQRGSRLLHGGAHSDDTALRTPAELGEHDYALVLSSGTARRETGAFGEFSFEAGLALGGMEFHDRVFGQQPSFQRAAFHGPLELYQAELHDGVKWRGARFAYASGEKALRWEDLTARLAGKTGFGAAPGPAELALWRAAAQGGNKVKSAGDSGELDALPVPDRIRRALWVAAAEAFAEYVAATPKAFKAAGVETGPSWAYKKGRAPSDLRELKTVNAIAANRAPDFEQAYRRLKLLMRQQGSHLDEQRFFALELRARQARDPATDKDVKRWEIRAAQAYGALADYGASLMRPLGWLGGVCVVFAVLYGALAIKADVLDYPFGCEAASRAAQVEMSSLAVTAPPPACGGSWTDLVGPAVFSLEITFAPIANPIRHHPWARELAGETPEVKAWAPPVFALLRLVHRILAVPLLFLLALALRRRFQMG
jgi:hypothetical protein